MLAANVLKLILRPVVRFFVTHSHSAHEFYALSKALFVEESEALLKRNGEKVSVSRISAMTGLHRRDISHIQAHQGAPWHEGASIFARVLARWQLDERFTEKGKPRKLSVSGPNSEFFELVTSISRDLHAGTVLRELVRAQLVDHQGAWVSLRNEEAIVPRDVEKGFSVLSRDVASLIKVAEANICDPAPIKHLHLRTEFDNIQLEKIPEIKQWLLDQGREFHRRAREFLAGLDLDLSSAPTENEGGGRVVLSTFGFAELGENRTANQETGGNRKRTKRSFGR